MSLLTSQDTSSDEIICSISEKSFMEESLCIKNLLKHTDIFLEKSDKIKKRAKNYIKKIRLSKNDTGVEGFITQFGLDNKEGITIMCLAEALLRIPDNKTANALINDKLKDANWERYLSKGNSLFMNSSIWGLMLTGKMINLGGDSEDKNISLKIGAMISRLGEPVIRQALKKAMYLLGNQFVAGSNIKKGLAKSDAFEANGYVFSYDMLGEGARTMLQADQYFCHYKDAIKAIGERENTRKKTNLFERSGISIKLSALHPRYELITQERLMADFLERIKELVFLAREYNISISIDAEESSRLDISLKIFQELIRDRELRDFEGIGFVLQAYQKRAFYVIDFLGRLSTIYKKKIPVRLVKGAYWDYEIKRAQELGLRRYPVFTRKIHTDVSYLACAAKLLKYPNCFYPQFATHNALTASAIIEIAGDKEMEFQKLYGMGDSFYDQIADKYPVRIYAPIGSYEELLPYLIRRLLENGANASFVNQVVDDEVPIEEILRSPIKRSKKTDGEILIPSPPRIYGNRRTNSKGFDLGNSSHLSELSDGLAQYINQSWNVFPIVNGRDVKRRARLPHKKYSPFAANIKAKDSCLAKVKHARNSDVEVALHCAHKYFKKWNSRPVEERANILENAANILEENEKEAISISIRETGKTIADAIDELRETVDFLRYYAYRAKADFTKPVELKSPTGEKNYLSYTGKGVFSCISPWNFPLAIFMGQIAAALVCGNTVIAKPAMQTPIIAYFMVKLLHKAGVPRQALHLLIGNSSKMGDAMIKDPRVVGVAFTGSTNVAKYINLTLAKRKGAIARLIAETGGQNAMIVDSTALPEQAVDDIITSAFGNAGQRCSALRVLYLQSDIADKIIQMLKGNLQEIEVGDPTKFNTDIGPVISASAKSQLNSHIAKMKRNAKLIGTIKTPDIDKRAVFSNGYFVAPHIFEISSIGQLKNEVFGPVLHIIRYKSTELDKVIREINSSGFGLTFGFHSRIEENICKVRDNIKAGNIYINRSMTGATVGVQPFGGVGLSGTGPKAGGPNYLKAFSEEKVFTVDTTSIGGNISLLTEGQ